MAFIFCGEEDYSGSDTEPPEAMGSLLSHVEFDTVDDLQSLAGALRIPYLDGIHLGELPEGKAGVCSYFTDGSCEVTLNCHSVLVAVHEFAHCAGRPDRVAHGRPFKKRMSRLIKKAEAWLEDRIEFPQHEVEEVKPTVMPRLTPAPEPAVQMEWWQVFELAEEPPTASPS